MFRRGYKIQPQPSNSFSEESETNPHDKKSGVIRQHLKDFNNKEWGFAIVRCNYSSQERWEKFLSFIKEDVKDYLDSNTDVWEALAWTVIEDPALDRADFTEASNRFGQWAIRDLEIMEAEEKGTKVISEPTTSEDRDPESDKPVWIEYFDRSDLPRHHFFIYVDKEVIDSVVDILDPTTPRDIPRAYFIKLCCQYFIMQRVDRKATRKVRQAKRAAGLELTDRELEDEEEMDDAGLEYEDSDEECEDYQRHHLQKFKASDIAELYAVMVEDFNIWPDFMHLHGQDSEISRVSW